MTPASVTAGAGLWGGRMLLFDEIPSTNTWAVEHSRELGHGDVVRAAAQTAGRGRLTRSWLTVPGAGIACSILLRDPSFAPVAPNVGQAAAVAVSDLLLDDGLPARVKWPNDVLVRGRKIAGVLAELAPDDGAIVLGIGLNVSTTPESFSAAGLAETATSIHAAGGTNGDPDSIFPRLMCALERRLDALCRGGLDAIRPDWTARDALVGRRIEVLVPDGGRIAGRCGGLAQDGRLALTDDAGTGRLFWSGDVVKIASPY